MVINHRQPLLKRMQKYRMLYLLFLPVIAYFIIFKYLPMYGIVIAFKDYRYLDGIMGSKWVGLKHFEAMYESREFWRVCRNTVFISLMKITSSMIFPITFAILINEIRSGPFKKTVQTISYLPHFVSWVVLGGIVKEIVSPSRGIINYLISLGGAKKINFLVEDFWFLVVVIVSYIWQTFGWGSIIYIAAISNIDQEQYESAYMDGANRFQQAVYITLPCMVPIISIMLILNMGSILSAGFDQIFNLYNQSVYSVADIFDTYVYRRGIQDTDFSFSAAVGLLKNVVGIVLVFITNWIAKHLSGEGIW